MRPFICFAAGSAALIAGGCSFLTDKELDRAAKTHQPVFVRYVVASLPDEYGGIDAHANLFNTSGRTIKYVDISAIGFNRVSDPVAGRERASAMVTLRFTGPLAPRRTPGNSTWPLVWNNQQVECVVVMRIAVTYMDRTVKNLQGADLDRATSRVLREGCPPDTATEEAAGMLAFWQESIERARTDDEEEVEADHPIR